MRTVGASGCFGRVAVFAVLENQPFKGWREDEAGGYLADSVSFRAFGPPFFTYVSQAPAVLVPDTAWRPQAKNPSAAVVVQRRDGRACFAQVKEEPAKPVGDTEQNTPAWPGAIAQVRERWLSTKPTTAKRPEQSIHKPAHWKVRPPLQPVVWRIRCAAVGGVQGVGVA
jgi:hypothetical protein